jgi:hypothetical protein
VAYLTGIPLCLRTVTANTKYNVVLIDTLAVLCYTLYRIHIKCSVLLEFSISSH